MPILPVGNECRTRKILSMRRDVDVDCFEWSNALAASCGPVQALQVGRTFTLPGRTPITPHARQLQRLVRRLRAASVPHAGTAPAP